MLRGPDGRIREVAVPPGADPTRVAAAGDLGVAPTPEGALTVFNLRTDIERGQVSLGRFDPNTITGLAISPDGDVAATVPVGDGDDVLLWAPAGATRVRELARGHEYSRVAVAGGRVAFVGADGLREGVRAFVIDPRLRRIVFRGPPAFDVGSLGFDGRNIAFALPGCLVAGPAVSRRTIPEGPCSRTDVAVDSVEVREGRVRVRVACINSPRSSCQVTARVRTQSGRVAGRLSVRVPVGSARVRAIRLNRHGRARGVRLQLTVRVASTHERAPARLAHAAGARPAASLTSRRSPAPPTPASASRPDAVTFSARPSVRRASHPRDNIEPSSAAPNAPATCGRRSVQSVQGRTSGRRPGSEPMSTPNASR